jgi:hypothetical protein
MNRVRVVSAFSAILMGTSRLVKYILDFLEHNSAIVTEKKSLRLLFLLNLAKSIFAWMFFISSSWTKLILFFFKSL